MAETVKSADRDPQYVPVAHTTSEDKFRLLFSSIGVDDPDIVNEYINYMRNTGLFIVRMLLCRLQGAESVEAVRKILNRSMRIRGPHAKNLSSLLYGDYNTVERRLVELDVLHEPDLSVDWRELLVSLDLNPDLAPSLRFASCLTLPELLGLSLGDPHAVEEACIDICHRVPVFEQSADLLAVLEVALTRATAVSAAQPPAPAQPVPPSTEMAQTTTAVVNKPNTTAVVNMTNHPQETASLDKSAVQSKDYTQSGKKTNSRGEVVQRGGEVFNVAGQVEEQEDEVDEVQREAIVHPTDHGVGNVGEVRGPVELADVEIESKATIGSEEDDELDAQYLSESAPVLGPSEAAPMEEEQSVVLGPAPAPPQTTFLGHKDVLRGHTKAVTCLCLLSDNSVISGSRDDTLKLWKETYQRYIAIFKGHTSSVWCVAVLPDGRLISGSDDMTLRIWKLSTGETEKVLRGHTSWVTCVSFLSENRVISGSGDRSLIVWDVRTGTALFLLQEHSGIVLCLIVLPNGQVASGDENGQILIWDVPSQRSVRTLSDHTDWVSCLSVLSSDRLASSSYDTTIRIWNYVSGECLSVLRGHGDRVCSLCVLSDGRLVSAGGNIRKLGGGDTKIRIWNPQTGECIQVLVGHSNVVNCLLPLSDGRLASGSYDNNILLWS